MTMKRNLTWFDSPEQSYLRVTKEDLVTLRILREMSDSSYGGKNYAYLIQEPDAKAFIETATADAWELSFEHIDTADFPSTELTGEQVQPLAPEPRCYTCLENGEEYCSSSEWLCPFCANIPECGDDSRSLEDLACIHLITTWDDEGTEIISPDFNIEEGITEDGIQNELIIGQERTDDELETSFGEALPLYKYFSEDEGDIKSEGFLYILTDLIPEIQSTRVEGNSAGPMSWSVTLYWAEDPLHIKTRVDELLKQLKEGYEQLAKLLPEKEAK